MSATTRKPSWLKQNYENLLLVVVLLRKGLYGSFHDWAVKRERRGHES